MEFTKKLITPEVAKNMIDKNTNNRRLREATVLFYTRQMKDGQWKSDTGECIKISKSGVILDGQHRLHAVIKSGRSIQFHLAMNLDESVFDVLDTGLSRNSNDAFKIKGIPNPNIVPSIIGAWHMLKNGKASERGSHKYMKPSVSETLELYYENQKFWDSVAKKTMAWYNEFAKILPPSLIGGLYVLFYNIDKNTSDEFWDELSVGMKMSHNAIGLLRNKLIKDKTSPRKMTGTLRTALIIKAWNYYRTGEKVTLLKFDSMREEFPIAI